MEKTCKNCHRIFKPKNERDAETYKWMMRTYCSIECCRSFRRNDEKENKNYPI